MSMDLRILAELKKRGKLSINALAKACGETYDTVRRHVLSLAEDGILGTKREGKRILVSLTEDPVSRSALALAESAKFRKALAKADRELAGLASNLVHSLEEKFPDTRIDLHFYGSFADERRKRKADLDVFVVAPKEKREAVEKSIQTSERLHARVMDSTDFSAMELKGEPTVVQAMLTGIHLQLPLPKHRRPIFV